MSSGNPGTREPAYLFMFATFILTTLEISLHVSVATFISYRAQIATKVKKSKFTNIKVRVPQRTVPKERERI